MKIQELYDKQITRRINPAVVVSEMEDYFINQEIDEYVFTQGITKNIYKFLDAVVTKKEGKTGVWISGYYGSGKSHFIKYLFYCLNERYREKAFDNFKESIKDVDPLEEPNLGLVTNLHNKLNKLNIDEIIFNIDAVSDNNDSKDRITRVFLNQLNVFRGYNKSNIALALYLEKPLDKDGNLNAFKDRIKLTFNEDWDGNQHRFLRRNLKKVIEIAAEFDAEIDQEALKASILDKNQDYTIEFLIEEIKDFLSRKDDKYKLLFLIDEVSQYIGSDTSLLLNLQTIIEEIGSQIGTQVWVVCTAQQDLSNLINNTDSNIEDFGKIMGRFETMISLESQDAAFITKKRILDKKSEGISTLIKYYKDNSGAIENQFVFDHDLYENYNNRDEFALTYPFIPYQFRLISDVFESFSNIGYVGEGVRNTERAILGITHFTAILCKDNEVGYFVPFDLFFNEQLEKNLHQRARSILDRAYHINDVKGDSFAIRVINTVFMISSLGDSVSVNFPANIENLALLLMESVDTAKLEMQTKVQRVLDVLVSKNIIQVSEGKYRFLKEDEIEVAELIKSTPVTTQDRLDYIFDDLINKIIAPNPSITSFGNKNFKFSLNIDDKEQYRTGEFNVRLSIYDSADIENLALATPSNNLVIGLSEHLKSDTELKRQILEYVRIQKYIRLNSSSATGSRTETLSNFRETNKLQLKEITLRFEKAFLQTPIISNNQVIGADELKGNTPKMRFEEMVNRHLESIYRKHRLSDNYAKSNADLLANAKSKQMLMHKDLSPSEEEVNNKIILMGDEPVVGDVVKAFEKTPYGWKDISTLDILLSIAKKGHKRFEWKNEEINHSNFASKALNSRERDSITIQNEKIHSQDEINNFIHIVNNEIFAEIIIPSDTSDFKQAIEGFKKNIEPKIITANQLKGEYEVYPFASHIKRFHTLLSELHNARNSEQVAKDTIAQKEKLVSARDSYMAVEEFIEYNIKAYLQIRTFVDANKGNFNNLDEVLQVKADELSSFLKINDEPWEEFPSKRKAYKELSNAIKERLSVLKEKVANAYQIILGEIEARRKELGIEIASLTADGDYWLQKIKKENEISQLEILDLKANDFRGENFKILENYKAEKEAKKAGKAYKVSVDIEIAAEMPPTTIESPEQLEVYIDNLRSKLMIQLSKNKKIFLT